MTEKEYIDLELSSKKEDEVFDFKSVISRYIKYWRLFVFSFLVFIGLSLGLLQFINSSYNIAGKILVKNDTNNIESINKSNLVNNLYKTTEVVNNEIEVLTSVNLMRSVLDSLSLNCLYKSYGDYEILKNEVYGSHVPFNIEIDTLFPLAYETTLNINLRSLQNFKLSEKSKDSVLIATQSDYGFNEKIVRPYGVFTVVTKDSIFEHQEYFVKFQDIDKLAQEYVNRVLKVERANNDAAVIKISLEEKIPEKGEDVINMLIAIHQMNSVQSSNIFALSQVNFIDNRLRLLSSELNEVEKNVARFKTENDLTNVEYDANSFSEQELDYQKKLAEAEIELEVLDAIEKNLTNSTSNTSLSSLSISNPGLVNLIANYNRLQLEKERLQLTIPENNPKMIAIRDQLNLIRNNILGNLTTSKESLSISIKRMQTSSNQFFQKKQKIPTMERQLVEISREQGIKEKLFLFLLQKREEAAMMIGSNKSNLVVIDKATTDYESGSPNKILVLLVSSFLSIFFPIVYISVKDLLGGKVITRKDVELNINVPILGEIKQSKNSIIDKNDWTNKVNQNFRRIKVDLNFRLLDKNFKTLLVTSSKKDEGKTFFTSNLGVVLAYGARKTILIDLDKTASGLSNIFGIQNQGIGISNYISDNNLSPQDIIVPVKDRNNLYVIEKGTEKIDFIEAFKSKRMFDLMNFLKNEFNHILIDSPPLGQWPDTVALFNHIDCCLYMVRSDLSDKKDLTIIEEISSKEGYHFETMVILNDV